jgi:hypothetical protein
MFNLLSTRFDALARFTGRMVHVFANTCAIIVAMLYVMLVQTINVWIWAVVYSLIGVFDSFEPALYFSLISFTTLGYGDITLGPDWRLLSGVTAANGFLAFGWSTAFMIELVRRSSRVNPT